MLPKLSRLQKHDIELLKHARRSKSAHFLVIYSSFDDVSTPRVAFSAAKKIAKGAVVRNSLRRRGYAAIAPLLPQIAPKTLVLLVYQSPWTDGTIAEMTVEIDEVFKKAGIYAKNTHI